MEAQNHEDPSVLPKVFLKHRSVTLSRGCLTLGQKDLNLFVFPFLPPYRSYLLSANGVSGSVLGWRESNVEPDRSGSSYRGVPFWRWERG